ncbi:hypothetical protein ACN28G_23990 [Micromonospora sp. WMMA1923]|uniref:hypothetical protein n=1 Tax=Micromonospora sp. WMMA1923 TaxID=3404125 RepID=UPI003B958A76
MQPPAGSQVSRVPAQRTPPDDFTPPLATPAPQRPQRGRALLALLIGVLALLASGGAAAGYLLYDRATAPDRSAPDVVVDNYLRAFLVDRDDTKASVFMCEQKPDLTAVSVLRQEILDREVRFDVTVRVSWGPLSLADNGQGQSVATTLTVSSSANGEPRSSRRENWQFDVTDDPDGWRVCGGRKLS